MPTNEKTPQQPRVEGGSQESAHQPTLTIPPQGIPAQALADLFSQLSALTARVASLESEIAEANERQASDTLADAIACAYWGPGE